MSSPPTQNQTGIDFTLDPTLHRNDDQAAVFTQALDLFGNITASDHVQNDVHALPARQALDFSLKVMRLVIDRMISSQS